MIINKVLQLANSLSLAPTARLLCVVQGHLRWPPKATHHLHLGLPPFLWTFYNKTIWTTSFRKWYQTKHNKAKKGNKIYVPCYSKNLIQTINQILQDNGINSIAYFSEMDDSIKREDLGDVSKSWKQYQVVLASLLVGAGVDFP